MADKSTKDFKNRKHSRTIRTISQIVISVIAVTVLIIGAGRFEAMNRQQNLELTLQAIKKATIQCYANEGRYPAELSYLEKNYSLSIDYDEFNVMYEAVAANIMPNINVFLK